MCEAGLLADARVELIGGELLEMNAQSATHATLTVILHRLLERAYGPGFYVRGHSPLRCGDHDQPEPDLALVRGEPKLTESHPTGTDVVLVIEVAITTVAHDRAKAEVYGRGGVPEYWLVLPETGAVEVHREPQPDGSYGSKQTFRAGDTIAWPERSDGVQADLLLP